MTSYINAFSDKDKDVLFAKTKATTHDIVMYLIQKEYEKGKKLCLESLQTAEELEDKELQIVFLYHLCDFLIVEGKLQEYIDVSEKSLQLEKELGDKTSYYYGTMEHLADAYIYKGGHEKRVNDLLSELYDSEYTKK